MIYKLRIVIHSPNLTNILVKIEDFLSEYVDIVMDDLLNEMPSIRIVICLIDLIQ